ncbi:ABC transporter ATP-binding protein [Vallitalea sediminicola]
MREIKQVFSYAKEYKNKVYLSIITATISVLVGVMPYYFVHKIIMSLLDDIPPTINYILLMSAFVLLCLVMKALLFYMATSAAHEAAYDTLMGMQHKLADKIIKIPMGEINKKSSGEFKNILVDLIADMETILAHIIPEGISNVVGVLVVILYVFILDWRMGLLILAVIPIAMIPFSRMMNGGNEKMANYLKASGEMNRNIVEYINGMEVIKIFNQTTSSFKKYTRSVENYKQFTLAWMRKIWAPTAAFHVILLCTVVFILPIGALFYIQDTLSLSTYILCLLLSIGLGNPLCMIVEHGSKMRLVTEKSKLIEGVFKIEELKVNNKNLKPQNYNIAFNNVTFAYEKKDVLQDVSFKAAENTVTALVGASGSGKSTIAKLIVRFWDIKCGEIKIGDINIQDISYENLMDTISYVSQDIYLFNTSIMENIRMGRLEATDDEVIETAKIAQCHEFIMKTENGYNTNIGDRGDKLSGGQKQRLSIARAILKHAPIIVLDEATAFTDPENEDKIQEALNGLIRGKTLIVIAHRLSTIIDADNIILIDDGKISAQGTHNNLLEESGIYKSMWEAHTQSTKWDITIKERN